jgi:hypothetical protein
MYQRIKRFIRHAIIGRQDIVSALQRYSGDALSQLVALRRDVVGNVQKIAEIQSGVSTLQGESGEALSQLVALRREVAAMKDGEIDYQLLMLQQQQLAQLTELEPDFRPIYEACRRFTMTSVERLYSLYHCISYISRAAVPGHLAECGVWRGGSCMVMAYGLLRQSDRERKIYLFDTYEGHPRPNAEKDVDLWGNHATDEWQRRQNEGQEWSAASFAEVRKNLLSTGYPANQLVFIKGMVEETVPANQPDALALLRLDTDWYDSTKAALNNLYPRLSPGGVLIVDDYGHYRGQREAVDEYFRSIGETPLLQPVDYSCRVMVKPSREASCAHDADHVG